MGSCGSEGQSNLSKLSNSCQFLEKVPITQEPMPGWGEVMHLKKSEGGGEWEEHGGTPYILGSLHLLRARPSVVLSNLAQTHFQTTLKPKGPSDFGPRFSGY